MDKSLNIIFYKGMIFVSLLQKINFPFANIPPEYSTFGAIMQNEAKKMVKFALFDK